MGQGPLTGGRRGFCAGATPYPGRGGGRGWRNQFYATGLTGWQRAQASAPAAETPDASPSLFARLESMLAEVLERLERAEPARRD
jgi:hypothetical protein